MSRYHDKYQRFYNSKQWKNIRNLKFASANGLCENCYKKGIYVKCDAVHHITPIEKDMSKALEWDNLICLCADCHNAEHERESTLQEFLKIWDDEV